MFLRKCCQVVLRRWQWLLAASAVVFFVLCWWFLAPEVPVEDDYDAILKHLLYPWPERLTHLADLHNEHRILTSRLVTELVFALRGTFDFRLSIFIGNFLQLILASIWLWLFSRLGRKTLGVGLFVMFLSLVHYANSLNALCSVQNICAMMLPLVALQLCRSKSWFRFAMGLCVAVAATFTSGCGIFVWCAIAVQEVLLNVSGCTSWKEAWRALRAQGPYTVFNCRMLALMVIALIALGFFFGLPNDRPVQVVKDVAQEGELLLAKTTVMGYAIEITPMFVIRHLAYAGNYFLSCIGGVVLASPLTVASGFLVLGAVVYLLMTLPRCRNTLVVGMLVYLLMTIASCAVLRASSFDSTIPSRYRIVCLSVFACVMYLVSERHWSVRNWFVAAEKSWLLLVVVFLVCYTVYAWPRLAQRRVTLRRNLACWPEKVEGIAYPSDHLQQAIPVLQEACSKGVYRVPRVEGGGEVRPLLNLW